MYYIEASITPKYFLFCTSDRTIKLWNIEAVVGTGHTEEVVKLSSQAVVAAHDKDINSLAVAPNDSLLCSGSQVQIKLHFVLMPHILRDCPPVNSVEFVLSPGVVCWVQFPVLNSRGFSLENFKAFYDILSSF